MIGYRRRPSAGFVLLVVVHLLLVVFFAWALGTPPLEAVWRLDLELGLGERGALDEDEEALLRRALVRHPALGEALIEDKHAAIISANDGGRVTLDYAYVVRPSPDDRRLRISYAGTRPKGAVAVTLHAGGAAERAVVRRGQPFAWAPPGDGPFPQLITLRLDSATKPGKRAPPVRLDWVAR